MCSVVCFISRSAVSASLLSHAVLLAVMSCDSIFIETCEAGLVLSVTRILRVALKKFRVYVCMYVCMYVCVTTPPKPLNRFA